MSNRAYWIETRRRATLAVAVAAALLGSGGTLAQQQQPVYPQQQPAYPPQPAYPQGYAGQPQQTNMLRQVFANTLSSVMQGVSTAATAGIVQGVSGSLVNWFDRRQGSPYSGYPSAGQTYQQQYPSTPQYPTSPQYPTTSPYPTSPEYPTTPQSSTSPQYPTSPQYSSTPQYPASPQYPSSPQYPAPPTAGTTYPSAGGYDPNATQIYDAQTGQLAGASANTYLSSSSGSSYGNTLYAGVAYEVHAVANGTTAAVNPATYLFRTGDQFVVYYRPSMPGRMEVYNVNPLGQQTRIDSVEMAAGQMARLGPYQFSGTGGQESLRLVLMPCSTSQLMAATRDIVNVSGGMPTQTSPGGFALSSCAATRSVNKIKTRDITKVAVDGMTSFALDPVSSQEYSSGQLDARDVTIAFRHE